METKLLSHKKIQNSSEEHEGNISVPTHTLVFEYARREKAEAQLR